MNAVEHPIQPEEIMACLDGEVSAENRQRIERHIAACEACQAIAADLSGVSRDMAHWQTEPAPRDQAAWPPAASPGTSREPGRRRSMTWLAAAAGLVIVAGGSALLIVREREAAVDFGGGSGGLSAGRRVSAVESAMPVAPQPELRPASGPMIARTAALRIVTRDFDTVRPGLDRMLAEVSGFASRIDATGARGEPRALNAVLRVPSDRLAAALTAIKALGQVISESQTGDDVTEQAVDLDARLLNARNTEKRLLDVLQRHTGKVGDILEAEREIARVRGEIESMDAQRRTLAQRVTYATVTLDVREETKASLDLGPSRLSTQLRNAMVEGVGAATSSMVTATLAVARIAPVLVVWGLILAWPLRVMWRRARRP